MKSRREFVSFLKKHHKTDDFRRPDFLQNLNDLADVSFAKGTVEGYLAAILIYHQLCEEILRVLIEKSHIFVQCSVFPERMAEIEFPKRMMFGGLLREYQRTLQLDESAELVNKCRELNEIRVKTVHRITLQSSIHSISKQTKKCQVLFDQIWELCDTMIDGLRGAIADYMEDIEDWEEWVEELEPLPKKRTKKTTRTKK